MVYSPAGFKELGDGVLNWHAITNYNFQITNNIYLKLQILWDPASFSVNEGDFLRWDGSKWVPYNHEDREDVHGLAGRTEDIIFSDQNKGIVLIDRQTGEKVRLYVENGILQVEPAE